MSMRTVLIASDMRLCIVDVDWLDVASAGLAGIDDDSVNPAVVPFLQTFVFTRLRPNSTGTSSP